MQWLLLILITPYIYLLSRIYRSLTQIRYYHPQAVPDSFLSVVVSCRNEEKNLPYLLKHLSGQDYNPALFEIIIIDDNSDDSTSSIASGFKGIKNLVVLQNSERGKKSAIRQGVSVSKGRLIVTTDADCRMGPGWLKTIASFFEENKPEMIILPVEMEESTGFFRRFQEIEFLSLQGITAGTTLHGRPVMCNGANLAFSKKAYNRYSGNLHDELISGDDVFLLHEMKSDPENKIMWLESAEARVYTKTSETFSAFFRQRARWISKAGAYKDTFTRVLGIVTFVTICLQLLLLIAGIFNPDFLWVFAAAFLLKSIPDYLIVLNTTKRYGRKSLMGVFLPAQIVYPLYIVAVFFSYLFGRSR
jgi:cellulose synthase/poly-beta-1,6-N-acetylglucosamine synthase-like glycosyltransferase